MSKSKETINYIQKQNRWLKEPECPPLQIINEINSQYSDALDALHLHLYLWSEHIEAFKDPGDDWTPHKIALAETILGFDIGDDLECETYTLDIYTEELSQP